MATHKCVVPSGQVIMFHYGNPEDWGGPWPGYYTKAQGDGWRVDEQEMFIKKEEPTETKPGPNKSEVKPEIKSIVKTPPLTESTIKAKK